MPRPKKPGGPEPKKRSRNGCWPCKHKKVKCGEEKPQCLNCERQSEPCDYSIRLNWEGRTKRKANELTPEPGQSASSATPETSASVSLIKQHSENSDFGMATPLTTERSWESPEDEPAPPSIDQYLSSNSENIFPKRHEEQSPTTSVGFRSPLTPSSYVKHQSFRDGFSASQLGKLRESTTAPSPYQMRPYPDMHANDSNAAADIDAFSSNTSYTMLPPMNPTLLHRTSSKSIVSESIQSNKQAEHCSKRQRLEPNQVYPDTGPTVPKWDSSYASTMSDLPTPPASMFKSGTSYDSSAENHTTPRQLPTGIQTAGDPRRLSVNSLLSSPTALESANQMLSYGVDKGFPDLDIPRNEDHRALEGSAPPFSRSPDASFFDTGSNHFHPEFGFRLHGTRAAHGLEGYYLNPVLVEIPRSLEPLPPVLLENQMNLLYFHHFLNHTARILVPHDCSENPFRIILPQMAVRDLNLMHLLLAYSASHRARLLHHPEPSNRVALWVRDVFPNLRHALSGTQDQMDNTTLATAIMLASLEIIAPNAFEVPVPWQEHLRTAREIIILRGPPVIGRYDKVAYFLNRWFNYLDVLGSLSGAKNTPLLSEDAWSNNDDLSVEQAAQIDCLFGFTSRCVTILARLADLARRCDNERIGSDGNIREDWTPSAEIIVAAEGIKSQLKRTRYQSFAGCPHNAAVSGPERAWEMTEMVATNDAFHWAGLVHLNRRVLGKPSADYEVQAAVTQIIVSLGKVRVGGTAEACLLFPIFTAGCDANSAAQREVIKERMRSVEGTGMTQIRKARKLMERVWETGKPWETLVQGEFFG
ncbi:hypothetical protein MMC26_006246 [Xylographa opegraphella]|nr:hypothetical protein [Xylographa opegraphella]